ncbi:glycosyltransferase family 4 protein [Tautonia plasticadhaerens]|uniref:Glycogen synthase n=1 Tax=Tautonia plasticadhaerens TaxID=2527974 RepID=A0A518HDU7_9BACT|nr:glycosyltransferase family 4 protein [Tautonia plasticadhaerens]QDV39025.1 Glycogen synthase [Tautonia plasticadhaerens]
MRIALVSRRYPPLIGGAEKVLSYLAPALADLGHEVAVLTARPPGPDVPGVEPVPTRAGSCTVRRLATSRLRFVGTWRYMNNLRERLEADPPDLAYVSMLKHDAYVAVEVGRRLGFPVVLRPEGAGATGDLSWQSWGNFGRKIGERTKQADAIVAISKAVEDELRDAGYDRSKIHRLPNGVPVPEPSWRRRDGWRDAPRAAFVGRLAPEKGLDTLIEAWPIVRRSFPAAHLTIYGEGPEGPTLGAGVGKLGLGDAITFAGPTVDPTAALRDADLFVLPSREEGMSVALLEAMALGIPVVASSIPGNRRVVSDFKDGRLAPVDDPEGLARVVVEQWTEFDRAFHMSRAARKKVEGSYSVSTMARQHDGLFRSLASARGG